MIFKCRIVKPAADAVKTFTVVEAKTAAEAASTYHFDNTYGVTLVVQESESSRYKVTFAVIEVEGHGEFTSRTYKYGIWRAGGVKRSNATTLADVATLIDWKGDPNELLASGWDQEETMEEASDRKARLARKICG